MLIIKETAENYKRAINSTRDQGGIYHSRQISVPVGLPCRAVTRSHGFRALKTIRVMERGEKNSDGRGGSPNKQNILRI